MELRWYDDEALSILGISTIYFERRNGEEYGSRETANG